MPRRRRQPWRTVRARYVNLRPQCDPGRRACRNSTGNDRRGHRRLPANHFESARHSDYRPIWSLNLIAYRPGPAVPGDADTRYAPLSPISALAKRGYALDTHRLGARKDTQWTHTAWGHGTRGYAMEGNGGHGRHGMDTHRSSSAARNRRTSGYIQARVTRRNERAEIRWRFGSGPIGLPLASG